MDSLLSLTSLLFFTLIMFIPCGFAYRGGFRGFSSPLPPLVGKIWLIIKGNTSITGAVPSYVVNHPPLMKISGSPNGFYAFICDFKSQSALK